MLHIEIMRNNIKDGLGTTPDHGNIQKANRRDAIPVKSNSTPPPLSSRVKATGRPVEKARQGNEVS